MPGHFPLPVVQPQATDTPALLADLIRRWVRERVAAAGGDGPANLYEALLNVMEPALLAEVLAQTQGNRLASSRWLGLARATVRKLIARHLPGESTSEGDD